MAPFLKSKFLFTLKLNFNGVNLIEILHMYILLVVLYQNLDFSKSGKSHDKIVKFEVALLSICVVKFEVENFEHLR